MLRGTAKRRRRRRSGFTVYGSEKALKTVYCLWNIRLVTLKTYAQFRKFSSVMISSRKRVAIIGGGVTGSCAANHLISLVGDSSDVDVVLFDQGGRGPGGRTSHRRVRRSDSVVLPDDLPLKPVEAKDSYQFDHGCQFFCASDERFITKISEWQGSGVVEDWDKRCVLISDTDGIHNCEQIADDDRRASDKVIHKDFFGILSGKKCYVGVGGMHTISRFEAKSAVKKGAVLNSGVRVSKILPFKQTLGSDSDIIADERIEKNTCSSGEESYPGEANAERSLNKNQNNDKNMDNETLDENKNEDSSKNKNKNKDMKWELFGTGGAAALHDSAEKVASGVNHYSLGTFDAVILTDASCSFENWHRASAGISKIKPEFTQFIKSRARIPLFTTMVAFDRKMFPSIDSAVFNLSYYQSTVAAGNDKYDKKNEMSDDKNDDTNDHKDDKNDHNDNSDINDNNVSSGLWFAARCSSKPGMHGPGSMDCWTLVSTPSFAVTEISSETMQGINISLLDGKEEKKVVFKPQENEYLNNGPAKSLVNTFLMQTEKAIKNFKCSKNSKLNEFKEDILVDENLTGTPEILYLQGQRWGSALPGDFLPLNLDLKSSTKFQDVEGTIYQRDIPDLRVRSKVEKKLVLVENEDKDEDGDEDKGCIDTKSNSNKEEEEIPRDYLYDDNLGLFYAGDFCSRRTAGVEAACLSGIDVANHVHDFLKK